MKNVQNDMNVVLRNCNAIFISPFVAHIQQLSLTFFLNMNHPLISFENIGTAWYNEFIEFSQKE
ncbi:MAG: hypothetical protein DRI56_07920 [Chloroflexota bacterium]|nr:MAG: hypothetical protein B6243_01155 [Anaerolineaceae bacterium 4572_5.2]RLD06519.1 MAG: hypothetical protein DRI56_07920 [Chloroflexota bacterium]